MGCFDSVNLRCENCGEKIELQSKAGECDLKTYHPARVPLSIAGDLDEDVVQCPNCEASYAVSAQFKYVGVALIPLEEDEQWP